MAQVRVVAGRPLTTARDPLRTRRLAREWPACLNPAPSAGLQSTVDNDCVALCRWCSLHTGDLYVRLACDHERELAIVYASASLRLHYRQ